MSSEANPLRRRCVSLLGHEGKIVALDGSFDDSMFCTASEDRTIRIWSQSECILCLNISCHDDVPRSITFDQSGEEILSAGIDKKFKVYNVRTGMCLQTIPMQIDSSSAYFICSGAFDTRSRRFVSCGGIFDDTYGVYNWNIDDGECKFVLYGHSRYVCTVCVSPDSVFVASGSFDKTVAIFDLYSKKRIYSLTGHPRRVTCVVFDACSRIIASSSRGEVRVWRVYDGANIHKFQLDNNRCVLTLNFSSDSDLLAVGSSDGDISILSLRESCILFDFNAHIAPCNGVKFVNSHNMTLLSVGQDCAIHIWNLHAVQATALKRKKGRPGRCGDRRMRRVQVTQEGGDGGDGDGDGSEKQRRSSTPTDSPLSTSPWSTFHSRTRTTQRAQSAPIPKFDLVEVEKTEYLTGVQPPTPRSTLTSGMLYKLKGKMELECGNYDQAIQYFEESLKLRGSDFETEVSLSDALCKVDRCGEAKFILSSAKRRAANEDEVNRSTSLLKEISDEESDE